MILPPVVFPALYLFLKHFIVTRGVEELRRADVMLFILVFVSASTFLLTSRLQTLMADVGQQIFGGVRTDFVVLVASGNFDRIYRFFVRKCSYRFRRSLFSLDEIL